jgi:hypothetical protein
MSIIPGSHRVTSAVHPDIATDIDTGYIAIAAVAED